MPLSTCTFERAWEHVTLTRQEIDGSIRIVVVWSDGLTCSHAFVSVQEALEYQRQFEMTLSAAGWVREEVVRARARANSSF
jgi:hypothetical protein